jgi:hypothetical protein
VLQGNIDEEDKVDASLTRLGTRTLLSPPLGVVIFGQSQ